MACGAKCCDLKPAKLDDASSLRTDVDISGQGDEENTRSSPRTCNTPANEAHILASVESGETSPTAPDADAGKDDRNSIDTHSVCKKPVVSAVTPCTANPEKSYCSRASLEPAAKESPPATISNPSCCPKEQVTKSGEIIQRTRCSSKSSTPGANAPDAAPCCVQTPEASTCHQETQGVSADSCEDECCATEKDACEDECCASEKDACEDECCEPESSACAATCCAQDEKVTEPCCSSNDFSNQDRKKEAVVTVLPSAVDLEKGIAGTEHVVLSVSGMTCTGCETKLKRTLGTLSYVSNLKTSLVLARAELDVDHGGSAEDIIKHLQRTTEFKCERILNRGSSLDCTCDVDPKTVADGEWPDGVLDVQHLTKSSLRISYDPKIVGARDLLEQGWARHLHLAPPQPDRGLDAGNKHVRKMGLMTLLSAILTIPVLVMAWAPLPEREIVYGSASLALATLVQVGIAGPFYPKAVKALVFSKVVEMDLLIVLSTSAAYIFSVVSFGYMVSGRPLSTGQFFETSTLLVTLIMVGRWVASLARQKAAELISIRALQAQTAVLVEPDVEIDARLLQFGDVFKVMPDSRVPTDGTVISGVSEVDESMLTGESKPVEKHPGSTVIAGSINGMGK
jgi:copper chaperone CopZ